MDNKLEDKLLRRFPVMFKSYYMDMTETCMCWGFSHGDGWFDIIWQLCLAIEDELGYTKWQKQKFMFKHKWHRKWNPLLYKLMTPTDNPKSRFGKTYEDKYLHNKVLKKLLWHPHCGFSVDQVKEKFGTLRFYCGTNDNISKFVHYACELSAITCEDCGANGKTRSGGWVKTQCFDCCDVERYTPSEMKKWRREEPVKFLKWVNETKQDLKLIEKELEEAEEEW